MTQPNPINQSLIFTNNFFKAIDILTNYRTHKVNSTKTDNGVYFSLISFLESAICFIQYSIPNNRYLCFHICILTVMALHDDENFLYEVDKCSRLKLVPLCQSTIRSELHQYALFNKKNSESLVAI